MMEQNNEKISRESHNRENRSSSPVPQGRTEKSEITKCGHTRNRPALYSRIELRSELYAYLQVRIRPLRIAGGYEWYLRIEFLFMFNASNLEVRVSGYTAFGFSIVCAFDRACMQSLCKRSRSVTVYLMTFNMRILMKHNMNIAWLSRDVPLLGAPGTGLLCPFIPWDSIKQVFPEYWPRGPGTHRTLLQYPHGPVPEHLA